MERHPTIILLIFRRVAYNFKLYATDVLDKIYSINEKGGQHYETKFNFHSNVT